MSSASRFCDGASSADAGSSSSQIGRGTAISRAIDNRRRCPANRYAAGKAARGETRRPVPARRRRVRRRKSTQNRRYFAPSAMASVRPGGRDSAPARRWVLGLAAIERRRPAAIRTRPAITRNRRNCRRRCGRSRPGPRRGETEIQAGEDLAAAAVAGQLFGSELASAGPPRPVGGPRAGQRCRRRKTRYSEHFWNVPRSIWRRGRKDLISPDLRRYVNRFRTQDLAERENLSPCQGVRPNQRRSRAPGMETADMTFAR